MAGLYLPLYLSILLSLLLILVTTLYLHALGSSSLTLLTGVFVISWPLGALWYWLYLKIKLPLQQSLIYCQSLNEGSHNILPDTSALPAEFQQLLSEMRQLKTATAASDDALLLTIVAQQLPYPLLVFNARLQLVFSNTAASDSLQRPLILHSSATALGFTTEPALRHPALQQGWQQHCLHYQHAPHHYHIYYALDLRHPLYQQQKHSQQQLIRVLSHELRNSLTPMASMTDTLLQHSQLPEQATREVLQRINARSTKLLSFIDNYIALREVPQAQLRWFSMESLLQEVRLLSQISFDIVAEPRCYGDQVLLSQLLLNLLKNAAEAAQQLGKPAQISLRFYSQQYQQVLELSDNGPGFSNPDNLFVPFYTTKAGGSGIGLPLCNEIMQRHNGTLSASNLPGGGAVLTASWPLH